ncbi:MAG: cysteine--tRNA ligase [Gammaproteobacteria bacterium]|nr:cysteine--tRNA ligase [Gammaproteobacteria bacterium]
MKLYNTYTNKIEEFKPIKENEVSIYYCGPTVYNYIHIGNARPIIFFDTLKKYLEHKGYKVILASNFTDLNEKILKKSKEEGISEMDVANKYINAYLDDVRRLNADDSYIKPRVTETIPEIIDFIKDLEDNGAAYKTETGDVYFRVKSVKNYGALSNRKVDELISGARVEVRDEKESSEDFALWKHFNEGITYNSPWGEGRPGWHTECCVMINNIFHSMIDIHGGGSDLIFPHHENEIAQSEACYHNRIANFWVHNARVNFGNDKMSKSLGNVIWTKDLKCNPLAYRLLVLSFPYRNIISYTDELQAQYVKEYDKIKSAFDKLYLYLDINDLFDDSIETEESKAFIERFDEACDNDMNTPNGVTVIYDVVKLINQSMRGNINNTLLVSLYNVLKEMLHVFGLDYKKERLSDELKSIYKSWEEARKNKDFAKADEYRNILVEKGVL